MPFSGGDVLAALKAATDALPIGIVLSGISPDGAPFVIGHNAAFARMVGAPLTPGAPFDSFPYQMYHPDRATPLAPEDWPAPRAARTGAPVQEEEIHLRRPDGEWRVLSVSAGPVASGRDSARRAVALLLDVTESRRVARDLRASEARFRAIFEQAAVGVAQIETFTGRFVTTNDKFCDIAGYACAEILAHRWQDLTHPDDLEAGLESTRRMVATHEPFSVEKRFIRGDGSVVWTNLTISPMWPAGLPPTFHICVAQDITAQRQLEEQYRQAQKLESVGRLAGGVAHDFNNLLTVILSCAEELTEAVEAGSPVAREPVEEIRAAGKRAADLTRQLLAFARKQIIDPVPLDLNALVRGAEGLLARVLGEDVELVVTLEPDLWPVLCDPGQLERVIVNLAVNARDAMPKGGSLTLATSNADVEACHVAMAPERLPGQWVRLTVCDTGTGMSPDVKEHLFEPFFTTKPRGSGTGLGLATVHGIVEQSGGHLHVRSEPGLGTTFEVCLPRTFEAVTSGRSSPSRGATRGTETVLLVEDDPLVREVTARSLRDGGYQLLVAASGRDALALRADDLARVRLLVTDVVMPGQDGASLGKELCRRRPGLRVLYVSGYTHDAIARRVVLDPGVHFLHKPFTAPALLALVRSILDSP